MTTADVKKDNTVTVSEVGPGPFVQSVTVRSHKLFADEPLSFPEGTDKSLSPNDFLLSSPGSCTSITLRMYARLKKLPLDKIIITLNRNESGNIDRKIELNGKLTDEQRNRLFEISNRCPIHKAPTNTVKINSKLIKAAFNA
jgi:putative redox protein